MSASSITLGIDLAAQAKVTAACAVVWLEGRATIERLECPLDDDLIVRAVGPKLTFLANGLVLAEETDASPLAGMVGVFVGGDMNEVLIDRFSVQVPE